MDDIQTLLDMFDDMPVDVLEQVLAFIRQNRSQLQREMAAKGDPQARLTTLGRAIEAIRRDFIAKHPGSVDADQAYSQQRLVQLLQRMAKDE